MLNLDLLYGAAKTTSKATLGAALTLYVEVLKRLNWLDCSPRNMARAWQRHCLLLRS